MPDCPPAPRRIRTVVSVLVACLFVTAGTALMEMSTEGMPRFYRAGQSLADIAANIAAATAEVMGCQVSESGFIVTYGTTHLEVNPRHLFGPLDRFVLLLAITIAATVAVCRVWGFRRKRTISLIAFSAFFPVPVALFLSAVCVGVALGVCRDAESAVAASYLARDAALVLSCAIVALSWWLAAWLGDDETASPPVPIPRTAFTASITAAAAGALFLGLQRALAAGGTTLILATHDPLARPAPVTAFLAARWAMSAALLLASGGMLLLTALRPNRFARWAWLPALAAAPLGGGIGSAVPLLAAVIAARDERFRALRGLALQPAAPARIARRDRQPFLPWIGLLTALLLWGAFVRFNTPILNAFFGLSVLAHPAVFGTALVAVVLLGIWEWRGALRQTRRWRSLLAFAMVLSSGAAAVFGLGAYREFALRRTIAAAEPYFERIRAALSQVPMNISSWTGTDMAPPEPALALAPPNAVLSRRYIDAARSLQAVLQIVHCRDARDAVGYAPSLAFRWQGYSLSSSRNADWTVGARSIPGTDYTFDPPRVSPNRSVCVAFFLVTPSGHFLRDPKDLAAEPPTQGAAAVQVILPTDVPPETRRQAVTDLLTAAFPAISTIANQR
jgi:hypothetical protein